MPGRGVMGADELPRAPRRAAASAGHIVLEINTRRCSDPRRADRRPRRVAGLRARSTSPYAPPELRVARGRRPGRPTPAPRCWPRRARPSPSRASAVRRSAPSQSAAGVDPALVHHYFGTKDDLFVAAMQLPVDPREVIAHGDRGPVEEGRAVPDRLPRRLGRPRRPPALLAVARRVLEPGGDRLLSEGFLPVVIAADRRRPRPRPARAPDDPRRQPGDGPDPDALRARAAEPLASLSREDVDRDRTRPTLQRYLTGELP